MWTMLDMVCYEDYRPRFEDVSKVPRDFIELARSCWCADQFARPLFTQVTAALQKIRASAEQDKVEAWMGTGRAGSRPRASTISFVKEGDMRIRRISKDKAPFQEVHVRLENGVLFWYNTREAADEVDSELQAEASKEAEASLRQLGVSVPRERGLLNGYIVLRDVVVVKRAAMQVYVIVDGDGAYAFGTAKKDDLQGWVYALEQFGGESRPYDAKA